MAGKMKVFGMASAAAGLVILACVLIASGCGKQAADTTNAKQAGPARIPVEVETVKLGSIAESVPVTGSMAALQDIQISSKTTAPVTYVAGYEGDSVKKGQLLVQMDASDLIANVKQAQANVASAVTKYAQAVVNYRIQVTQAKQGVVNARAALNYAEQNYLKLKSGNRPQQILEAQAQEEQAAANFNNAKINLQRYQQLYAKGAVARADLDTTQTTYDVDTQLLKNAQAALSLAKAGYQTEDILAAQQQINEAKTTLENQIANEQQVEIQEQNIIASQAGIQQTKQALAYAQQQVAYCSLYSPVDGIIAQRGTEVGQVATPGTSLLRVVDIHTMYYEPIISETQISEVHVGDPVNVRVDSYPGQSFLGRVAAVFPAASTSNRDFSLRVDVPNSGLLLRPGMFARGSLIARVDRDVPVVPATALVPASAQQAYADNTTSDAPVAQGTVVGPQDVVIVGSGDTARVQPVTVGISTMQQAEVTAGLEAGDRIVVVGQQGLRTGDKLAIAYPHGGGPSYGGSAPVQQAAAN